MEKAGEVGFFCPRRCRSCKKAARAIIAALSPQWEGAGAVQVGGGAVMLQPPPSFIVLGDSADNGDSFCADGLGGGGGLTRQTFGGGALERGGDVGA